jgi:hypothetical protein
MSHFFCLQRDTIRCEGNILYIPVRIHTNKVLTLEDFEKTKMYLHISAFKFRIKELADHLQHIIDKSDRKKTLRPPEVESSPTQRSPEDKIQDIIRDFVSSIMGKASAYMREQRCL